MRQHWRLLCSNQDQGHVRLWANVRVAEDGLSGLRSGEVCEAIRSNLCRARLVRTGVYVVCSAATYVRMAIVEADRSMSSFSQSDCVPMSSLAREQGIVASVEMLLQWREKDCRGHENTRALQMQTPSSSGRTSTSPVSTKRPVAIHGESSDRRYETTSHHRAVQVANMANTPAMPMIRHLWHRTVTGISTRSQGQRSRLHGGSSIPSFLGSASCGSEPVVALARSKRGGSDFSIVVWQ